MQTSPPLQNVAQDAFLARRHTAVFVSRNAICHLRYLPVGIDIIFDGPGRLVLMTDCRAPERSCNYVCFFRAVFRLDGSLSSRSMALSARPIFDSVSAHATISACDTLLVPCRKNNRICS